MVSTLFSGTTLLYLTNHTVLSREFAGGENFFLGGVLNSLPVLNNAHTPCRA